MPDFIKLQQSKLQLLILSISFYFTKGCTIYLFISTLKFTLNYTLKLLLHVSI